MKTVITIEGGRITVEVDDQQPVVTTTGGTPPSVVLSDIVVDSATDIAPDPPQKRKLASHTSIDKVCDDCGNPFTASGAGMNRRRYCDDCRAKRANTKIKPCKVCEKLGKPCKRHRDGPVRTVRPPMMAITPEKRQQIAGSIGEAAERISEKVREAAKNLQVPAPEFLPGYEKTPEEIEALRPRPVIEPVPRHSPDMQRRSDNAFADPWNCQKCRDHLHICDFHAGMEADGKRPPVGKPPISSSL